jgi:hypothetical protein
MIKFWPIRLSKKTEIRSIFQAETLKEKDNLEIYVMVCVGEQHYRDSWRKQMCENVAWIIFARNRLQSLTPLK